MSTPVQGQQEGLGGVDTAAGGGAGCCPQPGRGEGGPVSPSLSPWAPVGSPCGGAMALLSACLPAPFLWGAPAPVWTRQAGEIDGCPAPGWARSGAGTEPPSRCQARRAGHRPAHVLEGRGGRGVALRSPEPAVAVTAVAGCGVAVSSRSLYECHAAFPGPARPESTGESSGASRGC